MKEAIALQRTNFFIYALLSIVNVGVFLVAMFTETPILILPAIIGFLFFTLIYQVINVFAIHVENSHKTGV